MRDSFIFYKSFRDASKLLDKETRLEVLEQLIDFALTGEEHELSDTAKAMFMLIRPQIEANNKKYENGKKGGRPKTKTKPKNNQTKTKAQPNVNENDNVNANDNVNVIFSYYEENIGQLSGSGFEKMNQWLELFDESIIKYAIDLAIDNNVRRWAYIEGILKNWKQAKVSSLDEIKHNEVEKTESEELFDYNWLEEGAENE